MSEVTKVRVLCAVLNSLDKDDPNRPILLRELGRRVTGRDSEVNE